MMARGGSFLDLLSCMAGPVLWFLFFSLVYGAQSIFCVSNVNVAGVTGFRLLGGAIAAVTIVALAATGVFQYRTYRSKQDFLAHVGLLLTALSLLAVGWIALPIVFFEAC